MNIDSSHKLYHAWLRCTRSRIHLRTLKGNITKFKRNPRPIYNVTEHDSRQHVSVFWPPPCPISWGLILSDFAVNMRASLDYIAWELVIANPAISKEPSRNTAFPIIDTIPINFKDNKAVKDILPQAIPIIEGMQPYHRANWPELSFLSILRELSNITKHRFIIPTARTVRLNAIKGSGSNIINIPLYQEPKSSNVSILRNESNTNFDPRVTFQIFFEIPTLNPSVYDISTLDNIYNLIANDIFPRFTSFFK